MFAVSAVQNTEKTPAKGEKYLSVQSPNVMQHSPVGASMCVQHSQQQQQQVPMLNNSMCGWHNNKIHCNNLLTCNATLGTGTTGTKILKLKLKRSKLLRKKRDIIRDTDNRRRFSVYYF
ncbi:hypothetical protein KR018_004527 [Drosophila ironensis]|nr:hypothetical protein KR018_004527 [Drosophila ironensis]